jgi:hypothetical protein
VLCGNRILRSGLPNTVIGSRISGNAAALSRGHSRHDEAAARAEICFARKNLTDRARLDNQSLNLLLPRSEVTNLRFS